jgi:hypothetical protein
MHKISENNALFDELWDGFPVDHIERTGVSE